MSEAENEARRVGGLRSWVVHVLAACGPPRRFARGPPQATTSATLLAALFSIDAAWGHSESRERTGRYVFSHYTQFLGLRVIGLIFLGEPPSLLKLKTTFLKQ